ncbi:MAG: hypothetical protein RLY65_2057, partial [Pseudomonadota bacterium]
MMLVCRLLSSLFIAISVITLAPKLEAQTLRANERAGAIQPRVKNQDSGKK